MVYIINRPLFRLFRTCYRDNQQRPILYLKRILAVILSKFVNPVKMFGWLVKHEIKLKHENIRLFIGYMLRNKRKNCTS